VTVYRWAWTTTWSVLAAGPVLLGLLDAPVAAMIGAAAFTALCVLLAADRLLDAAAAGVVAAAVVAACAAVGPPVLAAAALAVGSSPRVVGALAGVVRRRRPVTDLTLLADDRLCAAWSESYVALSRTTHPAERLAIVNTRQAYLDELEARDAAGFRSWLDSGARPVGNPAPFFKPR
jgi:hypothetical protein